MNKNFLIIIIIAVIVGGGGFFALNPQFSLRRNLQPNQPQKTEVK